MSPSDVTVKGNCKTESVVIIQLQISKNYRAQLILLMEILISPGSFLYELADKQVSCIPLNGSTLSIHISVLYLY